ncbi:unnamed protein product [Durusdinium trenchii]|uniref:Uncharacterized protein n=1 Tax=Durusdinium trenchii TaxID=1381693 RepID=A0ABP0IC98_9DINO
MPALQLVCASSFYSDTEGAHINEAMHLPGGDPEDGLPEGPEDVADPHVPRKLLDEHMLRDKTVKGLGPFGLRVLGRRLFVCNSDQDEQLEENGQCGVVGTKFQLPGITLDLQSDRVVLPVRRWDVEKMVWTAEQAPHVMVEKYKLPQGADGRVDFDMLPSMPKKMTRFSPGEAPDPIEAAMPGMVPCLVSLRRKVRNKAFLDLW